MAEQSLKVDVVVHKAITLMKGESLGQFAQELSKGAGDFIRRKMNLTERDGCYMAEVFDNVAIWSVYSEKLKGATFYAVKYERDPNGTFKFSDTTEVRRMTVYEPAGEMMKTTKGSWIEAEKAVWTTAFINNLPDAAFAVILSGGKKDGEGKTVPRSLRMLPHHNESVKSGTENGSVDLIHLRNALARLPQSKIPASAMATAKAHLEAHAKELLKSGATSKACGDGKKEPMKKGCGGGAGGKKDEWTKKSATVKVQKDFWNGVL